jgi:hypothetical protein
MSARDPFNLIDDPVVLSPEQADPAAPLVVMPLKLEAVMDETIQLLNLIDDPVVLSPEQADPAAPLVVMPLELEAVMDETIQLLVEKLAEAESALQQIADLCHESNPQTDSSVRVAAWNIANHAMEAAEENEKEVERGETN